MLFYGLASCNGLETLKMAPVESGTGNFEIPNRSLNIMWFQVNSNDDKYAVMYKAEVEPEDAEQIFEMKEKDKAKALEMLKELAQSIEVAAEKDAVGKWQKIPNPSLYQGSDM